MSFSLSQILPSLQALGVFGYWLIGLASLLEAFFLTGVIVPGTLIVDAGGILVQKGLLDFFDLAWFVAIGSILGSELSYWAGKLAMKRLPGRQHIENAESYSRARRLFERRGGMALVIGRFLGPVAGFVPLAAGMSGMNRRKFVIWNIIGGIPYALAHVAIGYFLGDVFGRIGGSLTRATVLTGAVLIMLAALWGLLYAALRLLPLAWTVIAAVVRNLAEMPAFAGWISSHPKSAKWVTRRFDRTAFTGLPLTVLIVIFFYIGSVWLDSVFDFLTADTLLQVDARLAELIHHFQAPLPIRIATAVTAVGSWQTIVPVVAAALIWLLLRKHRALATGLLVSVIGNTVSVALLKLAFARPRSPLGFFTETSGSFPSGHAAASIAAYGMLLYVIWRAGKLRAETALLSGGLIAFAIGISRIYLIEHYLSDVLNGWLVGALWLTVGIAIAEWRHSKACVPAKPVGNRIQMAGTIVAIALVVLAGANVWRYDHPRNSPLPVADVALPKQNALAALQAFPATTESLMGSSIRPVSLVVLAKDETALASAVNRSGWDSSGLPGIGSAFDALFAAAGGSEDPTIETVSHFWRGKPNDLAFVPHMIPKAKAAMGLKARFWRTEIVTSDGLRAFVATIGIDDFGDGSSSQTNSDGTAQRDALVKAMQANGAAALASIKLSDGSNVSQTTNKPNVAVLAIR